MVGDSEFQLQIDPQRMVGVLYGVRGTRRLQMQGEGGPMMGGRATQPSRSFWLEVLLLTASRSLPPQRAVNQGLLPRHPSEDHGSVSGLHTSPVILEAGSSHVTAG